MGKIRVKTFGDEELDKKQKEKAEAKKGAKKLEKKLEAEKVKLEEPLKEPAEEKTAVKEPKKEKKKKFLKQQKAFRSTKYLSLTEQIDKNKEYSLPDALELLQKLQRGKFDETVELHINTLTTGVSGNVTLPHGSGKKTRVSVVSDALIAEIEKGIINFDILIAEPVMMAKLAKVAKILGPKGLMPNPKNGTITEKVEELIKKYEGGQISFKTEGKSPILHLTAGKISFGAKKLEENIESLIKAVKKSNIVNATLKSTMSPGLKLKI